MLEGKPKQFKSSTAKLDLRSDRIEKVEPANLNQAKRNVPYRNLLMTGRAVWKQKASVFYSTAGTNPQIGKLRCLSGKEAKRVAGSLLNELRRARSDDEYNQIIVQFLQEVMDAWPDNEKREQHVHRCDDRVAGQMNPDGTCECGWDWKPHQLTKECNCGPTIDQDSDAAGVFQFVVHRQIVREVSVQ